MNWRALFDFLCSVEGKPHTGHRRSHLLDGQVIRVVTYRSRERGYIAVDVVVRPLSFRKSLTAVR